MKELSIEQKAERYDKAIEKAEKWYNAPNIDKIPTFGNRIIEDIFPELYEPEGERIKNEIIDYISTADDKVLIPYESWITWLEKQGKETISQSYLAPKSASQAIKEIITDNANKVEPKFKVGDWISNGACTWRIDLIEDDLYCSNCDRFTCGGDIKSIDEQYHLWTIEDAKDGDILSYVTDDGNLWIMIYQSLYKPYKNHVHYRALLVDDDFTDRGTCCIDVDYLKPATREQRGLLFKRMQESGYIWDANKKELINIL
jgi:hypothetical protein